MFIEFPNKDVALKGVNLTLGGAAYAVYKSGYTIKLTPEWLQGEMHHISKPAREFWQRIAKEMGWKFIYG